MRGNVDTRLKKLDAGDCEALVLAGAGLKRLGFASRITSLVSKATSCPAVGQGALALEASSKNANDPERRAPSRSTIRPRIARFAPNAPCCGR